MKKRIAIFLIRRFPTQDRAALIREANEDLGDGGKYVFAKAVAPNGYHIHMNQKKSKGGSNAT